MKNYYKSTKTKIKITTTTTITKSIQVFHLIFFFATTNAEIVGKLFTNVSLVNVKHECLSSDENRRKYINIYKNYKYTDTCACMCMYI